MLRVVSQNQFIMSNAIDILDEHMEREKKNPLYQVEVLAKQRPSTLRAWFLANEQHKGGLYAAVLAEKERTEKLEAALKEIIELGKGMPEAAQEVTIAKKVLNLD